MLLVPNVLWIGSESPDSFCSAEGPSPTLISQLLSNCRVHGVGRLAKYLDLVPPALERGEGMGAESLRRPSAVVPGGQVLVAEPHPLPHPPSFLSSLLSPLCLQSIHGTIFEVFEIRHWSPRPNARLLGRKENW